MTSDAPQISLMRRRFMAAYAGASRLVERRRDLAKQTRGRRLPQEAREDQRARRERLLSARQQRDALELRARGLRDDLDAALQNVLGRDQLEMRPPAAEQRV